MMMMMMVSMVRMMKMVRTKENDRDIKVLLLHLDGGVARRINIVIVSRGMRRMILFLFSSSNMMVTTKSIRMVRKRGCLCSPPTNCLNHCLVPIRC